MHHMARTPAPGADSTPTTATANRQAAKRQPPARPAHAVPAGDTCQRRAMLATGTTPAPTASRQPPAPPGQRRAKRSPS